LPCGAVALDPTSSSAALPLPALAPACAELLIVPAAAFIGFEELDVSSPPQADKHAKPITATCNSSS
jgi:hypothetical protein